MWPKIILIDVVVLLLLGIALNYILKRKHERKTQTKTAPKSSSGNEPVSLVKIQAEKKNTVDLHNITNCNIFELEEEENEENVEFIPPLQEVNVYLEPEIPEEKDEVIEMESNDILDDSVDVMRDLMTNMADNIKGRDY